MCHAFSECLFLTSFYRCNQLWCLCCLPAVCNDAVNGFLCRYCLEFLDHDLPAGCSPLVQVLLPRVRLGYDCLPGEVCFVIPSKVVCVCVCFRARMFVCVRARMFVCVRVFACMFVCVIQTLFTASNALVLSSDEAVYIWTARRKV